MNRISTICISALISLVFFSCEKNIDNSTDNSNDGKVAILLPSSSSLARWETDALDIKTALYQYGYQTTLYTADENETGAALQVNQLKEALENGTKTIIITVISEDAINGSHLMEQYSDCNFICHDRIIRNNGEIDFYSACQPEDVGVMQAQYLIDRFIASGKSSMTLEMMAGPSSDFNSEGFFNGADSLLKQYIENGKLVVNSGKKTYQQVKLDSWEVADAKAAMKTIISTYYHGSAPDLILAANDNQAEGAILALQELGYDGTFPVITGQDKTETAVQYIKGGKQAMTVVKQLKDMAYNTAMVANSFICGHPVVTRKTFNNCAKDIPFIASAVGLVTAGSLE